MTRLSWDDPSSRGFEYGVDHGVFYPKTRVGHAWNGLLTVEESTTDTSQSLIYIDGVGHQNQLKLGNFAAVISAMTYPMDFEQREFHFCYRTLKLEGHYKIHLVYNALATPTSRNNSSINGDVNMDPFVWDLTTRPELIPGARASSHFTIDSSVMYPGIINELEDMLYGTETSTPYMPTVPELLKFFDDHSVLKITDHGDGSWTAEGPDDIVSMLDSTSFQIDWQSAVFISSDTYTVRTL